MPIITRDPIADVPNQPEQLAIVPDNVPTILRNYDQNATNSLQAFAAGSMWKTREYFSQFISAANNLKEVDPATPALYQQYRMIKGLDIRVEQDLSSSYDSATGITSVTGSATMYGVVPPNKFDYFTVDAGDSKIALMRIKTVERLNFSVNSNYHVDYDLVGYVDSPETKELYDNLVLKTIITRTFSRERFIEGLSALLHDDNYQNIVDLRDFLGKLTNKYIKSFYNNSYETIVIPGQAFSFYDPYVVGFLLKIVSMLENNTIAQIRQLGSDNNPYMNCPQLWTSLLCKGSYDVTQLQQKMITVPRNQFLRVGDFQGLAMSNVSYFLYPKNPDRTLQVTGELPVFPATSVNIQPVTNQLGVNPNDIDEAYVTATKNIPYIYPVLVDDYYVLSANYYNRAENMSVLEILVKDYEQGNTINNDMLLGLCQQYSNWGRLEQFYYGPLVILLIKESIRSIY